MGIGLEVWIECADPATAAQMAAHMTGLTYHLQTGRTIRWGSWPERDDPTGCTVSGWSLDLSNKGIRTVQDAVEATEVVLRLYHRLVHAPAFRYARVGWIAGATIPAQELADYMSDGHRIHCIVDDALFETLGRPADFVPFRPGMWWKPYTGESYEPLGSNDYPDLWLLKEHLFPTRR